MKTYTVNNNAQSAGCGLRGYASLRYTDIVKAFGPPMEEPSLDGKVSTEWHFVGPDGETFTLYDYKATHLYYSDDPTVEEFRARPIYDWHVGGRGGSAAEFIEFLYKAVNQKPSDLATKPLGAPTKKEKKVPILVKGEVKGHITLYWNNHLGWVSIPEDES